MRECVFAGSSHLSEMHATEGDDRKEEARHSHAFRVQLAPSVALSPTHTPIESFCNPHRS